MMHDFKKRFWVCLVLTIPILFLSPGIQSIFGFSITFNGAQYLLVILSSIIYVYGGMPFLLGFISETRKFQPGMMTLVSLSITISFIYSLLVAFGFSGKMFFWELATLIDVMLLGHWIEMRSIMGASDAVESLAKFMPSVAHVILDDGSIRETPVEDLSPKSKILVKPGEKIPADGVVIEGSSEVNESFVTGESRPMHKIEGDTIIGGTMNQTGSLTLLTSETSYLSQVIELVRSSLASKSHAQDLANKAASILTIIAITVGCITFSIWYLYGYDLAFTVERSITVMIMTCPHALGLAIPLVMVVIVGLGASKGLIIKNRVAFEKASDLDIVVFDKTGTLTLGEFEVVDVISDKLDKTNLLKYAAAVEVHSKHSLAMAIVNHVEPLGIPESKNNETFPGKGAKGVVDGVEIFVGNSKLLDDVGLTYDSMKTLSEGITYIFVANKNELLGMIGLADKIRDESLDACKKLKEMGIEIVMLTGDSKNTAQKVGSKLGIDTVISEVLPDQKVSKIKELQNKGKVVAMVGDGINDAPALTQAEVGIAIGAGTEIAIDSADIILVNNNPSNVVDVIKLSRKTKSKIIQNLIWASGYNLFAIPLAAGVFYNQGIMIAPAFGALVMSLSTIIVAINSRLINIR